jgi:hypothetical protein
MLLPQLEQQALYNTINFGFAEAAPTRSNGQVNATAGQTKLNAFLCPSDLDRLTTIMGHNSYAGNSGLTFMTNRPGNTSSNNGPFGGQSRTPIAFRSITDGLSNTAGFSERAMGIGTTNTGTGDPTRPTTTVYNYTNPPTTSDPLPNADSQACMTGVGTKTVDTKSNSIGYCWTDGNPSNGVYHHVMTPNTFNCGVTAGNGNTGSYAITAASSRHSGAVTVMLMDGSVKAIKNSIANTAWWALGTMTGGEVISADAY